MDEFGIFILFIFIIAGASWFGGIGALPLIALMVAFGGVYIYLRGKYYLVETYGTVVGEKEVALEPENPPYSTRPILSLADYDDMNMDVECYSQSDAFAALEYDIVAKNKAEASSAIKRARLNENHFSTDKLPADSQIRVDARAARAAPLPANARQLEAFANIEGGAFNPPDKVALEAAEKKILATYVPKESGDLMTTYSIDDADMLIKKIYKERKQVPTYRQREDGVYEVYEVEDENPKVVWEDEVGGPARADAAGDAIKVPVAAKQMAANLDPFFETSGRMRTNRADYTAFTPGLERMFAPTEPRLHWY